MPKGSRGEKLLVDGMGAAVTASPLSIVDLQEAIAESSGKVVRGGNVGARAARAVNLASPEGRREIAEKAAAERWS